MNKIIFFSNNISKQKEIASLFEKVDVELFYPKMFNLKIEPKEIGNSFAENAKIKSLFGFTKTKIPCFADDSGICIEALGWKPNIKSKRYIDNFRNRDECFRYIINKTKKNKTSKAFFQTSISYTIKNNYHILFSGKIHGRISNKALGKNGFGYDPIFIPDGCKKTFGEMLSKEKNSYSHRAIAINKLVSFLIN